MRPRDFKDKYQDFEHMERGEHQSQQIRMMHDKIRGMDQTINHYGNVLDDIVRQLDSDATYLKKGSLGGGIKPVT